MSGVAVAAPSQRPVTIRPWNVAQAPTGNHRRIAPAVIGKSAACATPSSDRASSSVTNITPAAANHGAAAVSRLPRTPMMAMIARIRRAPSTWPMSAPGIWNTA